MKKKLFIMILAAAAMNINAQLVVDSLGRVGIATDSVKSMLSVGTAGDGDEAINCNAQGKKYGLYLQNETINGNRNYVGNNILIGNHVTTGKPTGNVIIEGANMSIQGNSVKLHPGTKISVGTTMEIKNR